MQTHCFDCVQREKMPHARPALHSRKAQQFAEAGLKISLAKGEFDNGWHESAREPMEKMPHRSSSGSQHGSESIRHIGVLTS